ncbi:hypothetical protein ACFOEZ_02860 [Tianweitania populi]|uniref:Uncharacterized protein n=1 Tax=Tianweitania populi TaxID=1607949 RepID=A0A8J3DMY0_9HYPH|nr:hypothetical protein [Tianweitania populi]GHD06497.1 hypothetical protein GCM10016234_03910 [Tianweitania populi]
MKVSFSLTLDGMVRALRTRLHGVQDEVQWGGADEQPERRALRDGETATREGRDGSRGG